MKFISKLFLIVGIIAFPIVATAREPVSCDPVSMTKKAAFYAWTARAGRICVNCYEANVPLKQRIEKTTAIALELQERGYCLSDSVQLAKAEVQSNMGDCYIPICRLYVSIAANG